MDEIVFKRRLFDAFGGFGDKRIKKLEKSDFFICDDRESASKDARGQLFLWYCTVDLRVISGDLVHVGLGKARPRSPAVDRWWTVHSAEGKYGVPVLPIESGTEDKLDDLATLIASITKKRYEVAAYKYECPRVAGVLRRTRTILSHAWAD